MTDNRALALLTILATLLIVSLVAPVGVAAAQSETGNTTPTPSPTATPTPDNGTVDDNGSTRDSDTVSVRVIPVHFDAEYLSAERTEDGLNTTGPFVELELGRAAEQVTIDQPGATATLLADGRLVRVSYDGEGTPGEASLYTLRLYYPDGEQTLDLYARDTGVSVSNGGVSEYEGLVEKMLDNAESEGFERSPDGASNYLSYLQERSQLFENFFSQKARQAFVLLVNWFMNPVGIMLSLLAAAGLATWLYRNHGRVLDIISSDPGKSQRRRERIQLERDEQLASAADEHLSDLSEIGTMGEVYWSDAYNVATVYELAELFRRGVPVETADGGIRHVGGVEGLAPSSIHSSWLEAVLRDGRLASPEIALSHGSAAVHRMMSKYGYTGTYRETYEAIRELQNALDQQHGVGSGLSVPGDGSSPAGGD